MNQFLAIENIDGNQAKLFRAVRQDKFVIGIIGGGRRSPSSHSVGPQMILLFSIMRLPKPIARSLISVTLPLDRSGEVPD